VAAAKAKAEAQAKAAAEKRAAEKAAAEKAAADAKVVILKTFETKLLMFAHAHAYFVGMYRILLACFTRYSICKLDIICARHNTAEDFCMCIHALR
jgi:hypothetical protein